MSATSISIWPLLKKDFKPDGLLLVMRALALALADHRGQVNERLGTHSELPAVFFNGVDLDV